MSALFSVKGHARQVYSRAQCGVHEGVRAAPAVRRETPTVPACDLLLKNLVYHHDVQQDLRSIRLLLTSHLRKVCGLI